MNRPFVNLLNKDNSLSKDSANNKEGKKIKPLIISGFIISLSSMFLLIYIINNKLG